MSFLQLLGVWLVLCTWGGFWWMQRTRSLFKAEGRRMRTDYDGRPIPGVMRQLLGRTIHGMGVSPGEQELVFMTDQGDLTYSTDGDCCSTTWFADITGVDALLGGTVVAIEDIDMESVDDGRTRQEVDQFYGINLRTDKGHAQIVYRNISNGYYGGSCYDSSNRPETLVAITKDWQAGDAIL